MGTLFTSFLNLPAGSDRGFFVLLCTSSNMQFGVELFESAAKLLLFTNNMFCISPIFIFSTIR